MIGPRLRVDAAVLDPRADQADPGVGDLLLDVAVAPGEVVVDAVRHAVRSVRAVGVRRLHEVVGIGEQREVGRALRVGVDHVQRLLADRVDDRLRDGCGVALLYGLTAVAAAALRSNSRSVASVGDGLPLT